MEPDTQPRQFTTAYKLWILEEIEENPEEESAILLREGLTPDHIKHWRRQKASGEFDGLIAHRDRSFVKRNSAYPAKWQALPDRSFSFNLPTFLDPALRIDQSTPLRDLLETIWRGKWTIISTVTVLTMLTFTVLLRLTPVYSGEALIILESARSVEGIDAEKGLENDPQMLETEMEVMRSRHLASKIVDQFKLAEVEEFNPTLQPTSAISRLATFVNSLLKPPSSVSSETLSETDRLAGTGTWAFWMKTDGVWGTNNSDIENRAVIMSRHSGSGSRNGLFILQGPATGGWLNVQVQNASTAVCGLSGPAASDNLWHHIVITYSRENGGQIVLYKDGVRSGSCTNSATWNFNSQSLRLGASPDMFWEEWKGALDDVRIYNRVLLAQDITDLYNTGRSLSSSASAMTQENTSTTEDLVGHWKLDESSGTTAPDSSGNGNAGTLANGPVWTAGKIGNALSFDGVNNYVNVPSSANYDSMNQGIIINELLEHIQLSQKGKSRVISLEVKSKDSILAAQIANALAESYIADQLEAKFRRIRRTNNWLKERVAVLRQKVAEAETEVESFRNRSGLIGLLRQSGEPNAQEISQMNAELINARARRSEAEARLREAKKFAETLDSPLIRTLKERAAELDHEIAERSTEYGPAHPIIVNLQAQKKDMLDKIASEISQSLTRLENEVRVVHSRETDLVAQLKTVRGRLANANQADVELRALEREATATRELLESFLKRYQVTSSYLDTQTPNARIISKADVPLSPSFPKPIPILALSLFGSTLLGVMLTLSKEFFKRGFNSREHIERKTGVPVLGSVPKLGFLAKFRTEPESYTVKHPNSAFGEAIRTLNIGIRLAPKGQPPRRILVTSSLPREGKTVIATALAQSLSMGGRKIVLIKADLRKQKAKKVHANPDLPGLGEYLAGTAKLGEVIHTDPLSGVHVIPRGKVELTPLPDLLDGKLMDNLLEELIDSYDFVVVDAPPMTAVSDVLILGNTIDMILFVVRWAKTPQDVTSRMLELLSSCEAPVGIALSMVDKNKWTG
jgi:succinoglycan biosynthesis transport protein ExoP